MSNTPTVSIVLPTHNGIRYLDESVKSVVDQTYQDWELILVDDASSDRTPGRIDHWATTDPRIKAIHLTENHRLPGALNQGFRHALGAYWSWTSDDNRYRPAAFDQFVNYLDRHANVDVVYSDFTIIDDRGQRVEVQSAGSSEQLVEKNVVGASFLFRRRVFEDLNGYDESMFLIEDYDFWLRAFGRFVMQPMHDDLYEYRRHTGSLSNARSRNVFEKIEEVLTKRVLNSEDYDRNVKARTCRALAIHAASREMKWRVVQYVSRALRYSLTTTIRESDWAELTRHLLGERWTGWLRNLKHACLWWSPNRRKLDGPP